VQDPGARIAAGLSAKSGAIVGRTALRVRNPANAPDELQRALLEQFSAELASGVAGPVEAAFEINRGAGRAPYMRAIPMDALCLTATDPCSRPTWRRHQA